MVSTCNEFLKTCTFHRHVSAIKINLSVSSLVCLSINVTWVVLYFQLGKEWRDIVILSGIQGFILHNFTL
jgi:hypothetical protein